MLIFAIVLCLIVLAFNIFHPFIAMFECIRSRQNSGGKKVGWGIATLLLWSTGSCLYGIFGTHSSRLRSFTIWSLAFMTLSGCWLLYSVKNDPQAMAAIKEIAEKQRQAAMSGESDGEFDFSDLASYKSFDGFDGLDDSTQAMKELNANLAKLKQVTADMQNSGSMDVTNASYSQDTEADTVPLASPTEGTPTRQPAPSKPAAAKLDYSNDAGVRSNPFAK